MTRGGWGGGSAGLSTALVRQNVAGRCAFAAASRNISNTTNNYTQVQVKMSVVFDNDAEDLEVTFQNANRVDQANVNLNGLATVATRAAWWDGTNTYPIYFGVSRTATMEPGATATGSAMVRALKGQRLWLVYLHTWATAPANFPAATISQTSPTDYNEWGTALTDRTTSFTQFYTKQAGNYAVLPPVAITATGTKHPVVAINGDSIASDGSNDKSTDDPDLGWVAGALSDAGIPYVNIGTSGVTLSTQTASPTLRAQLYRSFRAAGVTHMLLALGTNDWAGGQTAAQIYAGMQLVQSEVAPMGIKVIPVTLQPKTDSTNTTYNGTETNTFTQRPLLNAMIIAGNGVGNGYFDLAAVTQSTANTNLWRTDLRTAASIAVTNGGTGYVTNDVLFLPGGGVAVVNGVTSGAITSLQSGINGGGWIVDPTGAVAPYRQVSNSESAKGIAKGAGATLTYGGIASQNPTTDGIHPDAALTRWMRRNFATAAPNLFTV